LESTRLLNTDQARIPRHIGAEDRDETSRAIAQLNRHEPREKSPFQMRPMEGEADFIDLPAGITLCLDRPDKGGEGKHQQC
jgi:hypothetical protein